MLQKINLFTKRKQIESMKQVIEPKINYMVNMYYWNFINENNFTDDAFLKYIDKVIRKENKNITKNTGGLFHKIEYALKNENMKEVKGYIEVFPYLVDLILLYNKDRIKNREDRDLLQILIDIGADKINDIIKEYKTLLNFTKDNIFNISRDDFNFLSCLIADISHEVSTEVFQSSNKDAEVLSLLYLHSFFGITIFNYAIKNLVIDKVNNDIDILKHEIEDKIIHEKYPELDSYIDEVLNIAIKKSNQVFIEKAYEHILPVSFKYCIIKKEYDIVKLHDHLNLKKTKLNNFSIISTVIYYIFIETVNSKKNINLFKFGLDEKQYKVKMSRILNNFPEIEAKINDIINIFKQPDYRT